MFSTSGPAWHSVENKDDQGPLGLHCVREQEVTCSGSRRGFIVLSFPQKFKLLLTPLPMGIEKNTYQINFFILKSRVPIALLSNVKWIAQVNKVKVKVAQSCPTLCKPMAYTVYGILQTRRLEQVDSSFSRGSSRPRDGICISWVSCTSGRFFTTESSGKPLEGDTHLKITFWEFPWWSRG